VVFTVRILRDRDFSGVSVVHFRHPRINMNSTIIAFPRSCFSRPKKDLKLQRPKPGVGEQWITTSGRFATTPYMWQRIFRLLIVVQPMTEEDRPVDKDACHYALTKLAIDFSRSCYGEGVDELLQMIAVLERSPAGPFLYTVLFEVPEHASSPQLMNVVLQAFEGLLFTEDEALPTVTISEGAGAGEVFHLMLRSTKPLDDGATV
jgi:hypothetical protein